MISQIMAGETVTVITPNGINFPQTEQPQSTHQMQDSLKKRLKAEIKIIGVNPIQSTWGRVGGRKKRCCLSWEQRFFVSAETIILSHRDCKVTRRPVEATWRAVEIFPSTFPQDGKCFFPLS
jgi:hypothetical protein